MTSKLAKYGSSSLLLFQHLTEASTPIECHRQTCSPIEEYCDQFEQACKPCSMVCDPDDINFDDKLCKRECIDFIKLEPFKNDIHHIQMQQNVILILLVLLLIITAGHFIWKLVKCLKNKRSNISRLMGKLRFKKQNTQPATHCNGKDLGGITIPNMSAINDIERAPSQIYSLTEGSVRTVTTPISSRHPAENTTPSPQPNEYSYDNQGLVVTPITEKPSGAPMF